MYWDHLIKNGTIVSPKETYKANIYVKDGKIAAITNDVLEGEAREITDAEGLYVLPGLIDTHVHSRDPGAPQKEDFYHSTQAAAAGGITTVFEMPNVIPAIFNVENLHKQIENLTPKAHVDFAIWGLCLGDLNKDDIIPLSEAGVVAFKFFWGYAIDSNNYQLIYNYDPSMKDVIAPLDDGEVFKIFRDVAKTDKLIAIHAENADMINVFTKEVQATGDRSYEALLRCRPSVTEETVIQTAISFSKATDARLHILHMSSKEGVDLIEQAQYNGLQVTAETCPNYLLLDNKSYDRIGSMIKGYPLVRYKEDQDRLWEGIQDGVIDLVCSDHAPHTVEDKKGDLWSIPAGSCGVETLAPLMIDSVNKDKITINELSYILSEGPAKLFNLYPQKGSLLVGTDADITIVDLNKKFTIEAEKLHSVSKVTAHDGYEVHGAPVRTIVRGTTVAKDRDIVSKPTGEFIKA